MSAHNKIYGLILLILISLAVGGCGAFSNSAPSDDRPEPVLPTEPAAEEGYKTVNEAPAAESVTAEEPAAIPDTAAETDRDLAGAGESAAPPVDALESREEVAVESEAPGMALAATPPPAPTMALPVEEEAIAEFDRAETTTAVEVQQSEPLRAGEVDDNAAWDDYLLYRRNNSGLLVHDRNVSERYIIEVNDSQGNPILGATVRFFLNGQQRQEIYSAHTYANGRVLFHPLALDIPEEQVDRFLVEVQKDNLLEQFTLTRFNAQTSTSFNERWTVTLDTQNSLDTLDLDVLFLIDATGSMATYRDRGDSFVTRTYEFTPDVRDFSKNLNTVYADGGGDYPESLNEGLHDALNGVEWRGGDAVQLIFLVADAPPHLDYPQDYDYVDEMADAARRGIKIFPIASSGLDDQGEYIFRQLAQYTQGRFIFLTYEGPTNGGAPGDVTTHHVDDYSVENLDALLVQLVTEELAYQSPQFVDVQ
jgi:hypothetical protein